MSVRSGIVREDEAAASRAVDVRVSSRGASSICGGVNDRCGGKSPRTGRFRAPSSRVAAASLVSSAVLA